MKNISICSFAAFILAAGLFLAEIGVAQQTGSRENQEQNAESGANVLLPRIGSYAADDSIPAITILPEPAFTGGNSNVIYWEPLPDFLNVRIEGNDYRVSRDQDCNLYLYYGTDSLDVVNPPGPVHEKKTVIEDVAAGEKSVDLPSDWNGKKVFYRLVLEVYIYELNLIYYNQNVDDCSITSSIQDAISPTINPDSVIVTDSKGEPGKNGWINTDTLRVNYFGLTDPAGLDSAFVIVKGDTFGERLFNRLPDGKPGPLHSDGFFMLDFSGSADAVYPFSFGARDAAYSSVSHGPGTAINAVWDLLGNESDSLVRASIKLDRTAPVINLSAVDSIYSPEHPDYNSGDQSITIRFSIFDAVSHVDISASNLDSIFNPPLSAASYSLQTSFNADSTVCNVAVRILDLTTNLTTTLNVNAFDNAGNEATAQKGVRFRFDAPEISNFRMVDPDFVTAESCLRPDSGYANQTRLLFDKFAIPFGDIVDSMRFTVSIDQSVVGNFLVDFPADSSVEVDPLDSLGVTPPADGARISVTIAAIDDVGNEQPAATCSTKFVIFDQHIAVIDVTVRDTTAWIISNGDTLAGRNGAYPGWTNDDAVFVYNVFPDPDLYRLKEYAPGDTCFENPERQFVRDLSGFVGSSLQFSYAAVDLAGNVSNAAADTIVRDNDTFPATAAHFKVFDPKTGSELVTADDSVYIQFQRGGEAYLDFNRIVVADSSAPSPRDVVYYLNNWDDILTVPTGDGKFWFSIVDFAGNESKPVLDSISVKPEFDFDLFDTSTEHPAQRGWTNEAVVSWQPDWKNVTEEQIEYVCFYNWDQSDSVTWQRGEPKLIDLSRLYRLNPNMICLVLGKAWLCNSAQTTNTARDSITFDDQPPQIFALGLTDTTASPWPADKGFTNNLEVNFYLEPSSDADSMFIDAEGFIITDKGNWQLPATVPVANRAAIHFVEQGDTATYRLICSIRDSAGNFMQNPPEQITSITFVQQPIAVTFASNAVKIAETDTGDYYLDANIVSTYAKYICRAVTFKATNPADTTQTTITPPGDAGESLTWPIKFHVTGSGIYGAATGDKGGNASDTVWVDFEVIKPPKISLTLYDYSEFDSTALSTSDALYTDALAEEKMIVAVIRPDFECGKCDSVQVAFMHENLDAAEWRAVTAHDSLLTFPVSLDSAPIECQITMQARAKNSEYICEIVTASINHDTTAPRLDNFDVKKAGDSGDWRVEYDATDAGDCPSGVAGIVIVDSVAATGEKRWTYLSQQLPEKEIGLLSADGLHHLRAFVVDNADVDQDIQFLQGDSLAFAPLGKIDHASKPNCHTINVQTTGQAFNYPNHFNPEREITKFYLPLDDGTIVDLRIFDLFGNLVLEQLEKIYFSNIDDGGDDSFLQWNGRNGYNELVASGTYLAVVKTADGKILDPIKIGVLRRN